MKLLCFASCCLLLAQPLAGSLVAADPGVSDTVRVGCPVLLEGCVPGDTVGIPLYLWNDSPVNGLSLGFAYNNEFVEITSWNLEGSVIPPEARPYKTEQALPQQNQFLIAWSDPTHLWPIPATPGDRGLLLGSLYLRVLPGALPCWISLDSTYVDPGGDFLLSALGGELYVPRFLTCPYDNYHGAVGLYVCGDANGSGMVNISDVVFTVQYIFPGSPGPLPYPGIAIDANCSGIGNIADAVYVIQYIFAAGPAPCAYCP